MGHRSVLASARGVPACRRIPGRLLRTTTSFPGRCCAFCFRVCVVRICFQHRSADRRPARAVQGFGAALLVPGSLAIISSSFAENERGRAIGTWSGFSAITTAIGPVIGGWLIEQLSWRAHFFINVPIALLIIFISLWRVPESSDKESKGLDWLGAILLTFGLAAVVYGV